MTDPTYFARIGNEAEREMALTIGFNGTLVGDIIVMYPDGEQDVFDASNNKPVFGGEEVSFSDFIRRFVPLSVIGSLAACHGMSLFPKVTATNPPPNPSQHETTDAIGKWSLPCSICGLYTTRTSGICISCSQQL